MSSIPESGHCGEETRLSEEDLADLAAQHGEALRTSLLSFLSPDTIKTYYRFVLVSEHEKLFAVREQGRIVGACVLSNHPGDEMKRFLLSAPVKIVFDALVRSIVSASSRKVILGYFFGSSAGSVDTGEMPEIVQIFAHPRMKNKKIGSRLLDAVETDLRGNGCRKYFLKTVRNEENQAVHFYQRRGFSPLGEKRSKGKEYVYFFKTI